jgi:hypothetical protein
MERRRTEQMALRTNKKINVAHHTSSATQTPDTGEMSNTAEIASKYTACTWGCTHMKCGSRQKGFQSNKMPLRKVGNGRTCQGKRIQRQKGDVLANGHTTTNTNSTSTSTTTRTTRTTTTT